MSSEHMQPNLASGDRVLLDPNAYRTVPPKRGEIIAYRMEDGRLLVSRVVGVPGDTVQVTEGQLYLNGQRVPRELVERRMAPRGPGADVQVTIYRQSLPGASGSILFEEWSDRALLDNTPVFKVPEDAVFLMGDCRDNSADSRAFKNGPGYLPFARIEGRVISMKLPSGGQ